MHSDEIPPRIIGLAIAELADARVRAAWQYLDTWRVLSAAGIPAHDLRHGLETEQVRTQPRDIVRDWARKGSRGLLVLYGTPGTGKTFAAVRWAVTRHEAGRGVTWQLAAKWPYAFAEQDAWVKRGRDAAGLIVDDMGTGETAAPKATEAIEAMLLVRLAEGRSAILLSNANAAETRRALGERLWDRVKLAGGVHEISERPSLRKADTVDVDSLGRSPTWHRHAAIIAAVGCERVDGELQLGGSLGGAAANEHALELLELDRAAVFDRGRAIYQREADTAARMRREFGIDVDPAVGLTFGQFASGLAGKVRGELEEERRRREAELRQRLTERIPAQLNPRDVDTAQAIATRAGIYVRGNADQGFEAVGPTGSVLRRSKSSDRAWVEAAASVIGEAVPA